MIGNSENRVSFNGNGTTTAFPYTFKILDRTDLKLLRVAKDGTETVVEKDYYINLDQSIVYYPGYAPGQEPPEYDRPPVLANGERLVIYRDVPITQRSAFDDRYPFSEIEKGLDKLTIIAQQLADGEKRGLKVSKSVITDIDTTIPIEAGKTFRWSEDGLRLEVTEDPAKVLPKAEALLNDVEAKRNQALADIKQEKQNIVNDVIASLPIYDGEVIEV